MHITASLSMPLAVSDDEVYPVSQIRLQLWPDAALLQVSSAFMLATSGPASQDFAGHTKDGQVAQCIKTRTLSKNYHRICSSIHIVVVVFRTRILSNQGIFNLRRTCYFKRWLKVRGAKCSCHLN